MRAIIATAAFPALFGCGAPAEPVSVDNAWVRLPAVRGQPAAGYFTVTARDGDILQAVAAPGPMRVELHESMAAGGVSSMRPLASVPLAAGEPVRFEPGGKHLMIFGVDPRLRPGGKVRLVFRLAKARPKQIEASVIAAGDEAPDGGH